MSGIPISKKYSALSSLYVLWFALVPLKKKKKKKKSSILTQTDLCHKEDVFSTRRHCFVIVKRCPANAYMFSICYPEHLTLFPCLFINVSSQLSNSILYVPGSKGAFCEVRQSDRRMLDFYNKLDHFKPIKMEVFPQEIVAMGTSLWRSINHKGDGWGCMKCVKMNSC